MKVDSGDNRQPAQQDPCFLVGVGRSGTSYTLSLINATSRAHLTFEGRMLKEGIRHSAGLTQAIGPTGFDQLLDHFIESESETNRNSELIHAVKKDRVLLYDEWKRRGQYGQLMRMIYWQAFGRTVWGDKLLRAEYLPTLLDAWPQSRVVVLYRDPRAVFLSQSTKWGTPAIVAASYWNAHFSLTRDLQRQSRHSVMAMRYEDLMEHPETTTRTMLDHLAPGLGGEAPAVLARLPPISRSVSTGGTIAQPLHELQQMEEWCWHGMKQLGYEPSAAVGPREVSGTRFAASLLWQYRKSALSLSTLRRKQLPSRAVGMVRRRTGNPPNST